MLDPSSNEAVDAPASIDTGFDAIPITATVSPALAPERVETGFGDLGGTFAPIKQATPTVNGPADACEPDDPDVDLDARVAAILPNSSTTDWIAVSAFMAAVVPWPASGNDAGWIALANGFVSKKFPGGRDPKTGKYPIGDGEPFNNVDALVSYVGRANRSHKIKDIFFCLSRQRDVDTDRPGTIRAKRSTGAALAVKAIWLDIDVGKQDGYQTVEEALKAAITFCEMVGLPPFSAIVGSGGGIHVYWISDKMLTPEDWRRYADGLKALAAREGLKCDLGVTTDVARILRMPGTFNHKLAKPRPCQLFNVPLTLYDFPSTLNFLTHIAPLGQPNVSATAYNPFHADADMASFKGKPIIAPDPADQLGAGVNKYSDRLVDPRPIFRDCGFYRDAFETGGKEHKQDLWMYAVLGTTFMVNGSAYAHEISKGHPDYSPAGTDAMYNRKVTERHDRGLGYPQCSTIRGAGCKSCATCPLLSRRKSPLNIRPDVSTGANPAAGDAPQADPSRVHSDAEFVGKTNPITVLMALHAKGAGLKRLFDTMNQTYAVVKYGTQILVATIDDDICLMKVEDFHKMLANIVVVRNNEEIAVSRLWFKSKDRRQYLGAGVVFQPGGPPEIKGDMLNLWRGFGIKPMPGNWSLLRDHIFKEVCSGRQEYFDYLIRWMAYAVQHPDRPMGVAVAFLGAQGAGKGIVARTFGKFFGKHFAHIANGDQLTGRFNASIGMSCVVFLDEALWAGDKKGEGVLKALITEPSLQLEAKFRDPIRVENRLRIIVASNNDWAIPAGIGDRRWFVLNVADTYSGIAHQNYWDAVYNQIDGGGAAAMLHDLLTMDVSSFNVRAVPHTAAKALQQVHSLQGTMAWLHDILFEGSICGEPWQDIGLTTETDRAYMCYVEFSNRQRAWKPEIKAVWSKNIQAALGPHVALTRPTKGNRRVRSIQFGPLADCRHKFSSHLCAPDLEWQVDDQQNQPEEAPDMSDCDDARLDLPADEWEPDLDPEPDYETEGDAD